MAVTSPRRRSIFASRLVSSAPEGGQPRVLEDLRRAILDGDEPPGTVIPIDAVAAFFGVSQIPVRESLKILTGEGLVEHRPHIGYSVAKLRFEEFRELYDVRQALETSALRASVPLATSDDDALVGSVHEALAEATRRGDEKGYHSQSRRFHMALIAPSGMQRLLRMYESAWNVTEPARPMARVSDGGRSQFHADHDRMIDAFVARDAERLVTESAHHYEHLRAAIAGFADDPDLFLGPE
ncbi:GntR family transcriptional regulator [Aeromicrobium wangtongii]|uniref:GntR family transcriptional regulator n=1 Tax=Aeromicrobium wangtongii TaxID=2969247 RepID=A0ABY5M897_9ACTN|nr:GntR family transcriptional regulator [Aeromicrobium wangtongii]MCD9196850.1 GntR family transcriptional regulator [Aeromicrobium wangtongii]UUP14359.1 GntR family transcriptional regulator [Aeromicrobium wangtongii]